MEKALFSSWERHEVIAPCYSAPLSPPKPCAPPLCLPLHVHTPTHLLYTLIWLFCLLMTQACRFLSRYTVNTGALAPRGLMDWSRLFTAVLFLEWLTKGTKGPLCPKGAFPILIKRTYRRAQYLPSNPPPTPPVCPTTSSSYSLQAPCLLVLVQSPVFHLRIF